MSKSTIVSNLNKVFATGDSTKLSPEAYKFITLSMGFIAHFNRSGFASSYEDLRLLARNLQTSEYGQSENYNREWADELDRRGEPDRADIVRAVVDVAITWEGRIRQHFAMKQRQEELELAVQLASKYGFALTAAPVELEVAQ